MSRSPVGQRLTKLPVAVMVVAALSTLDGCSTPQQTSTPVPPHSEARSLPTGARADAKAKVFVRLGAMTTAPKLRRLSPALTRASRRAIAEIPGVQLIDESDQAGALAARAGPPVVLITGRLNELGSVVDGDELVMSVRVEYLIYRMPSRAVAAIVSGSARARVGAYTLKDRTRRLQLEKNVLLAAVESAVHRTPSAFEAASR